MPRVSVVIPNYQGETYIESCLESLLMQTFSDMTIYVIDNGSRDDSVIILENFLQKRGYREEDREGKSDGGWIRYRSETLPAVELLLLGKNTGFCHAVNVGIMHAKEKYLFLLNNDTTLDGACVSELSAFMDRHPDAFSVGAKMLAMQDPTVADDCGDYYNALGYAFAAGKGKKSTCYQKERRVFSACAGAAMYRRDIFDRIGLFDENHFAYLEDVDIGYRARIHGYHNYFIPTAIVYHAGSAVSGSRHNVFKVSLSSKNSVYLVYKNQPLLQGLLNLPFLIIGFFVKFLFFTRKKMGGTYMKGLGKGVAFCFSGEARMHKVRFRVENLSCYIRIQLELWQNIIRMFTM